MEMKEEKDFKWSPREAGELDLATYKVVIVGGTGGLGRAIGTLMASLRAQVTIVGQTFRDDGIKNITFIKADLSSIEVSKTVAEQIAAICPNIVVFTTGIFASIERQVTAEGLERDMAVSYLNRLTMIRILASKLEMSRDNKGLAPRVFLMGYPGSGQLGTIDDLNQEKSYGVMKAHMNTVAGNEALVLNSAQEYPGINFYGLNPGLVKTNIRNNLLGENSWKSWILEYFVGLFTKTADQYALRIVPLLIAPELEERSGTLYNDKGNAILPSEGMTEDYAARYVKASEDLLRSKDIIQ